MQRLMLAAIALIAATAAVQADPYITKEQVDFTHLLPTPPAIDTGAGQRDLAEAMRMRAEADDDERARAIADAEVSIFRFADVLGAKFREGRRLQKTIAFFAHVTRDTLPLSSDVKTFWRRARPFAADPNIHPSPDVLPSACNRQREAPGTPPTADCPNGVSYSFPSGHSTFGTYVAILLAEMVPEKRAELMARGRRYGDNRVINGVHYPTDVEGGRIAATVLVALMMQNPHFRADLAEATAELRAVLGLSPR
jgi:acid phosphatase (class A)